MAKCDQGYLCQICGEEVKGITQSDLYLRYVIGMVDPELLHLQPERHILCNPSLAQFIDDPDFKRIEVSQEFDMSSLDPDFVKQKTTLISRGYRRLKELRKTDLPITEYPLPEFLDRHRSEE